MERLWQVGAGVAVMMWCAIAVSVFTGVAGIGLIETLLLFAPLVHVPLGFRVIRALLDPTTRLGDFAHALLPVAAMMAAASFFMTPALAIAWPAACALAAIDGFSRLSRRERRSAEEASLAAAFLFLTIGGVWLVLSRFGITPGPLTPQIVLLASTHFHFTGFALPVFAAATMRTYRVSGRNGGMVFPLMTAGIILGPILLAAGNLGTVPVLKLIGALVLMLSSFALAGLALSIRTAIAHRAARPLIAVASAALLVGMTLVGIYTVGEFTGEYWLHIPQMARFHGMVNALGFVLCGLVGWAIELNRRPEA